MGVEDTLAERTGLKQGEAQQNCIPDARPDGLNHIFIHSDCLNQHGIDCEADDNEKRLKTKRKQASQIVLTHLSPFAVCHRRHGNGRDRRDEIDFDHTAIDNHQRC